MRRVGHIATRGKEKFVKNYGHKIILQNYLHIAEYVRMNIKAIRNEFIYRIQPAENRVYLQVWRKL
jgi:hypothetical protein